ncbi:hypothetical protein [Natronobacterium gregoryi]|uniref:Uncharacterized protein n=1 Tax=Natronobacterium gregoryi (strain ATCC 43098 / DSM 3393 / CCM 3738 / CIP 104747 / IAM 13177 / JCM 8860 / NBRC 102187 / NCIMB 2189 / SP2) TaxID=797304 RepID=L9XY27_NATGS|nr:hypothetical protein [Natronobacterium gregoryi]ELY66739.1 hypothetical protein C490_12020 [Natronobacterium gregoryi SP2]
MSDEARVTGLCPTVDGYVLAERDGDEATCLICGEAVEPVHPETSGGNNTNGLEGDGTNRNPAIQPERDDVERRRPYAVYGNGAAEQAIDAITEERILRPVSYTHL